MNDIIVQTMARWGVAGMLALVAGYIIYKDWRENRSNRNKTECHQKCELEKTISDIRNDINGFIRTGKSFQQDILERIKRIEGILPGRDEGMEGARMMAIAQVAPSINSILSNCLEECGIDHIALALLHNGTTSLSGIPYIKMGVIAERYKPHLYPQDGELVVEYNDENIVKFNKLPLYIIQNQYVEFDIDHESTLAELDFVTYTICKARGVRHLSIMAINDSYGVCNGILIAYNFQDEKIDQRLLQPRASTIEKIYQGMLASFKDPT